MSTSLLYHGFGVRGYRYVKTEYAEGEVVLTIEQPRESYACSDCGSAEVIGRGQNYRRFRTVPIGRKRVYLGWSLLGEQGFEQKGALLRSLFRVSQSLRAGRTLSAGHVT